MKQKTNKMLIFTSLAAYFTYFIHGIGASILGQYKPEFAAAWGAKTLADEAKLKEEVANADILVNATLAGMKPHEELTLIKDKSMFRPDLVVADVVYNPAETRMVKEAKEAGCKLAIGGKGMLLWQGAAAYKLYTGLEMPTAEYQKFQEENENK